MSQPLLKFENHPEHGGHYIARKTAEGEAHPKLVVLDSAYECDCGDRKNGHRMRYHQCSVILHGWRELNVYANSSPEFTEILVLDIRMSAEFGPVAVKRFDHSENVYTDEVVIDYLNKLFHERLGDGSETYELYHGRVSSLT
jgi:hypothetical protein